MLSTIYKAASTAVRQRPISSFRSSASFALFSTTTLASSSTPSAHQKLQMAVKEFVETTNSKSKVVIYSKSWCPYCKRAKDLFKQQYPDVEREIIELDERDDGGEIQGYLLSATGQRTVPSIWINQKHIGGCDDLMGLNSSGQLVTLLNA